MISPATLLRYSIIRWLSHYCRQNKSIRHCFIRHSTASSAQNALLSDFDLAFFVEAPDFDQLQKSARRMRDAFRKTRILNCIVLPATESAYRMCAAYYPLRSTYPMSHWLRVFGDPLNLSASPPDTLPFDHGPEAFLSTYIVPVLQQQKHRHLFEAALMRRKLARDSFRITGRAPNAPPKHFFDVVVAEVKLWDCFFSRCQFPARAGAISLARHEQAQPNAFSQRWASLAPIQSQLPGLASLWVYPCFFDDRTPYLVVNLTAVATAEQYKNVIQTVLAAFAGLCFRLQLGTERSMLARIGGLSRVSLLDPWLFQASACCLSGDAGLRNEIHEPSLDHVKAKLQEYLLYLSYRVFCLRPYPYLLYELAFTMDRLFHHRELVTNHKDLGDIYGKMFLPQSQLQGLAGRKRFLDAWAHLHNFDLFSN